MNIILASASPRRKELLESIGLTFQIIVSESDENFPCEDPSELVSELAKRKASAVYQRCVNTPSFHDALVIGADTVVYSEGHIFGKPASRDEAKRMITSLSGRSHSVFSGIAVIYQGKTYTAVSETQVVFSSVPSSELERYLDTSEPYDKAGAYGIQGKAGAWVKEIHGSYSGVVGLPIETLVSLIRERFGISLI